MNRNKIIELVNAYNQNKKQNNQIIEFLDDLLWKEKDSTLVLTCANLFYESGNYELAKYYYDWIQTYHFKDYYEKMGNLYENGYSLKKDIQKAGNLYLEGYKYGSLKCGYQLSELIRKGEYKIDKEYSEFIDELFHKIKKEHYLEEPLPEIFIRKAQNDLSKENRKSIIKTLNYAKKFLEQRILFMNSESDLKLMKELILLLYEVKEWDWKQFDLFDLYFISEKEWVIEFKHKDTVYQIHFYKKGIEFEDHIYNTIDEFFQYATLENQFLVQNSLDLYGFKKVK